MSDDKYASTGQHDDTYKPREWWIYTGPSNTKPGALVEVLDYDPFPVRQSVKPYVHVVEYSLYQSAMDGMAEYAKRLKDAEDLIKSLTECCKQNEKSHTELEEKCDLLEMTVAAKQEFLEEITQERNEARDEIGRIKDGVCQACVNTCLKLEVALKERDEAIAEYEANK